jgi:hypothetical protein
MKAVRRGDAEKAGNMARELAHIANQIPADVAMRKYARFVENLAAMRARAAEYSRAGKHG